KKIPGCVRGRFECAVLVYLDVSSAADIDLKFRAVKVSDDAGKGAACMKVDFSPCHNRVGGQWDWIHRTPQRSPRVYRPTDEIQRFNKRTVELRFNRRHSGDRTQDFCVSGNGAPSEDTIAFKRNIPVHTVTQLHTITTLF